MLLLLSRLLLIDATAGTDDIEHACQVGNNAVDARLDGCQQLDLVFDGRRVECGVGLC